MAGVGHRAERFFRECPHLFDGLEGRFRTHAAVQADHVGGPLGQPPGVDVRSGAVDQVSLFVGRHLGHHHHFVAGRFPRRVNRLANLVQIEECFEDQQVHSFFEERLDLFAEHRPRLGERGRPQWFDTQSQGAHRAGDIGPLTSRLAGQPHPRAIDVAQPVGQAERLQARPAGPKRVRLQDLGAGLNVVFVHLPDQRGRGEIQLVVAAVDEDAARVDFGAHGPVGDEDPMLELAAKLHRSRYGVLGSVLHWSVFSNVYLWHPGQK